MSTQNNFVQISIGMVCSKEYFEEFIQKLEKKEGGSMKIIQNNKQISIQCSNQKPHSCNFCYLFAKKVDVQSKEIGLELKKRHTQHSVQCNVNNQEICFQRNRVLIMNSKPLITNILLSRYEQYGPQNPKTILEIVSHSMGYDQVFINKGIRSQILKRRIKKKFDNLVAEIRKQHNLTPTKIKQNRSVKKLKPKFSLFKQPNQNNQNYEQKIFEEISPDEQFNDESEFQPSKKITKTQRSNKKQFLSQNDQNNKKNQNQSGDFDDDLLNFRTPSSSFELYQTRKHRKLIKKQW